MSLTASLQHCLHSVGQCRPSTDLLHSRNERSPPVFVVDDSFLPVRSSSFLRFFPHIPRLYSTPEELVSDSPYRPIQCGLPRNVSGSASTSALLRSYFILKEAATLPAVCMVLCLRFINAVPPSRFIRRWPGSSLVTRCLPRFSRT